MLQEEEIEDAEPHTAARLQLLLLLAQHHADFAEGQQRALMALDHQLAVENEGGGKSVLERLEAGSHARFEGAEALRVRGRARSHFAGASEEQHGVGRFVDLHAHAIELVLGDGRMLLREGNGRIDGGEWGAERAVAELADTHGIERFDVLRSESGSIGSEEVDEGSESRIVVEGLLAGSERALFVATTPLEIKLNEGLAEHLLPEAKTPISQDEGG